MAKATVKKDIVKVILELTHEEASSLFEILDDAEEQELLGFREKPIYEALRDVLV